MKRPTQIIIALTLIAVATVLVVRHFGRGVPIIPTPQFDVLGGIAAEEVAKLLSRQGRVVVVVFDATDFGVARLDGAVAQFRKTSSAAGLQTLAVETIRCKLGEQTLPARVAAVLRKHAGADALVTFGPAYGLRAGDVAGWGTPLPKWVSVLTFDSDPGTLKKLFQSGAVQTAITIRSEEGASAGAAGPANAPFVVLTPATADALVVPGDGIPDE